MFFWFKLLLEPVYVGFASTSLGGLGTAMGLALSFGPILSQRDLDLLEHPRIVLYQAPLPKAVPLNVLTEPNSLIGFPCGCRGWLSPRLRPLPHYGLGRLPLKPKTDPIRP